MKLKKGQILIHRKDKTRQIIILKTEIRDIILDSIKTERIPIPMIHFMQINSRQFHWEYEPHVTMFFKNL